MLTRLALRLATVEALRPYKALPNGPFPTDCGAFVFDTRIEPIDDLAIGDRRPVIVVFTDEDNGDAIEQGNGAMKRRVDLVLEISIPAQGTNPADPDGDPVTGIPITDAELEAKLDLVGSQVRAALRGSILWSGLVQKINDWDSTPHRTSEEGYRLAMRTERLKVQIADDCVAAAPAAPLVGLDRLPPKARAIANALDPTSYGYKVLAGVADTAPTQPVATPLAGVDLKLDVADPSGARDGAPDVIASAETSQA